MTKSLQELSDRLEIQDLLVDYADAIDRKDFDALDDLFTPDAVIDYTAVGGIRGSLPEIKEFLVKGMSWFSSFQHLTATPKVVVDGDEATGRAICHNPMVIDLPDGPAHDVHRHLVRRHLRPHRGRMAHLVAHRGALLRAQRSAWVLRRRMTIAVPCGLDAALRRETSGARCRPG